MFVGQRLILLSQIPNSFNTSATSTICLIAADPASAFRDAIDQPNFPAELRTRITRVIALSKLKTDFKQFEARRKLFGEHDIFLADDRVVTFLPKMLGKVFYKGGVKRPVPISIAAQKEREDGKRVKVDPAQLKKGAGVDGGRGFATPVAIAKEIESALSSALVHLAPGTTTSVRVGRAGMTPEEVSQNIEAVVSKLVEKFVTKGWRNIKAIHLKGTSTVALPIWHANELWVDDEDVHEEKKAFGKKLKPLEAAAEAKKMTDGTDATESPGQKKRKRATGSATKTEGKDADKHAAKKVKQDKLAEELATRKDKLKKQKEAVMAQVTEVA